MESILTNSLRRADRFWLLDGAMGTQLQNKLRQRGQDPFGLQPELLNLTHPEIVTEVHREYLLAGANILYTNTFGASRKKLQTSGHTPAELISAAVQNARQAIDSVCAAQADRPLIALDIGPLGELMEPSGTLSFAEAYELFCEQVRAGITAGVDLVVLETMTDLYEVKAGILAVRESCEALGKPLPLMVSMTFEATGRTFTGCCVPSMAAVIEGLGADLIGFNCSLGPREILPLAKELRQYTSLPIFIKPNAGLPDPLTGEYAVTPEQFAAQMADYLPLGIRVFGGCCGTDPQFIAAMKAMLQNHLPGEYPQTTPQRIAAVCTPTRFVPIDRVRVIGERINPTGKKRLKQAILERDFDYILSQGLSQVEAGADILDVNMGMPDIDEAALLPEVVQRLQSVLDTPLQIDSSNPKAVENALRLYNGKAIVNSVNGEERSMQTILPLVKKYGAAVVALTMDEKGIPLTAQERFAVAERIVSRADAYGIPREDIFVDCLTLTASVQQKEVVETLKAMRMVKEKLGCRTVLGVSNISFGLPNRELLNHSFLLMALEAGLDLPIINPNVPSMLDAIRAYEVLYAKDEHAARYIENFSRPEEIARISAKPTAAPSPGVRTAVSADAADDSDEIAAAIHKGLGEPVRQAVKALLQTQEPEQIINERLIPALDAVGNDFEKGKLFLPQMIQSAQAAQAGFEEIKNFLAAHPKAQGESFTLEQRGIVLATVHGDVHDIGKNIVKVILENYGFPVLDLGRDVPAEKVVEAVKAHHIRLVGLSALMTTTLKSMEETIAALRRENLPCKVMVGGAVLTEEYAKKIGADFYARDAKASADIAKAVLIGG